MGRRVLLDGGAVVVSLNLLSGRGTPDSLCMSRVRQGPAEFSREQSVDNQSSTICSRAWLLGDALPCGSRPDGAGRGRGPTRRSRARSARPTLDHAARRQGQVSGALAPGAAYVPRRLIGLIVLTAPLFSVTDCLERSWRLGVVGAGLGLAGAGEWRRRHYSKGSSRVRWMSHRRGSPLKRAEVGGKGR